MKFYVVYSKVVIWGKESEVTISPIFGETP